MSDKAQRLFSFRPTSIRARMTLGFAAFIAALMLLTCAAFFFYTRHNNRKNANELLTQAAREVRMDMNESERNSEPGSEREPQNEELRLSEILRETYDRGGNLRPRDVAMLLLDKHGKIIAHSAGEFPAWPLHGDAWRAVTVVGPTYDVVLAWPWFKNEHELREKTLFLLILSALVVAATAGGAWFLVGQTLSPIDQLARQAQSASTAQLSTQLRAASPDAEIARLVATLNDLLARWSETAQSRERFYAAAAHELRTPLQALGGHLEVALSRERNAEDYKNALVESRDQTERLTSLVQDLLLLNQLDAHTTRPAVVEFDLADLCENELRPLRALAAQRDVKIELDLPPHCEIEAPWNHATMLLRNLLENAVKYATSGGVVRVALQNQTLTICNDCTQQFQTDKLFEPFFRPDASRTSSTGGNGLGLAICRSICDANAWQIALKQDEKTLCATVIFPAPKS